MATVTNRQRAEAVKQIDTILVGGTWIAAETLTLTINNKGLVITIGNGTSVQDVAESIRDAWNALSRLDGQSDATNTNTSNFGGQEFGEFAEATAVIYTGSDSTVRLIADRAGKPFTLTVAETSTGVNEVQSVSMGGTVTGGTFTLTYSGQTTAAIAWNASAATVDAALEALSNIGAGDVTCTGGALPGAAVTVTFTGALAETNVTQMTADGALLTGTAPTVTVTTTTQGATGGTLTHTASSQAATGPEWWNNADNWDGGSVPAHGDSIILANSAIGFKHGLPTNLQLRAAVFRIYQSFTGWLGLPAINNDNPAKPYPDYRPRYPVFFDHDGFSSALTTIDVGLGDGVGSPLLNIQYNAQLEASNVTVRVHNTGAPQLLLSNYALYIATNVTSVTNALHASRGSICVGDLAAGKSATLSAVKVGFVGSQTSDVNLLLDDISSSVAPDIVQNGGAVNYFGSTVNSWELNAGVAHWRKSASLTTLDVYNGLFNYVAIGTTGTLTIGQRGVVDCNHGSSSFTITNLDMHAGAQFLDDNDRVTVTNGPDLVRCGLEDVVLRRGKHLRVTKGAVS